MPLIQFVNRIWFETGAIKRIASELQRLGMSRPLVCTDKGIVFAGILDSLRANWPENLPWIVFDKTPSNPTEKAVKEALARHSGESCDGIVAIGGGSPIDLAKAVNLLVSHPEPLSQYETARKGQGRIGKVGPLVVIPTTAGTGSEVSVGTVIITSDGRKSTIASPNLIPAVAICDPQLTLKLPRSLTAATGMDAVTHCIEAYLSPLYNPIADAIALDGLERAIAGEALDRAVSSGGDLEARSDMMMAAIEGALAFTKGLGAVHSMSHAAGRIERLNLHHGTLNAVILPTVLRFNAGHVGDKLQKVAKVAGLQDAAELPDAIAALSARIGIPASLSDMGVTGDMVDEMVVHACNDVSTLTNPVRPTEDDYRSMFRDAMGVR